MFVIAMVGGAIALGLAINATDQALDGGIAVMRAAKKEGVRDGIRRYQEGLGAEREKEAYKEGYEDCKNDVKEILG